MAPLPAQDPLHCIAAAGSAQDGAEIKLTGESRSRGVSLPRKRSMIIFGATTPKLIARITVIALMASPMVASSRSKFAFELLVSCTSPLAVLKRKRPGIIETTEANPMAANGIRQRRATGVRINPTDRHATRAPVAIPAPAFRAPHLKA